MGRICHHAIVVTSYDKYTPIAHAKAILICGTDYVLPLGPRLINSTQSFLVTPDGSKEHWPESNDGDRRRALFVDWLNCQRFSDGSTPYDWVLIEYGERGDERGAAVLHHAWEVPVSDDYAGPHELALK